MNASVRRKTMGAAVWGVVEEGKGNLGKTD
jgi:hypothetical protein